MSSLIFCSATPTPPPETVTATAADTVDFEAIAAEQNRCAEMQHLLGDSSLKIAFRQAGAQCLVGDTSTGVSHPIVPAKCKKDIFCICTFPILEGSPHRILCFLDLSSAGTPMTSPTWRGPVSPLPTGQVYRRESNLAILSCPVKNNNVPFVT
jgi:hypothetical protein